MMTYAEAERKMAELMRDEMNFWYEIHPNGGDQHPRDPGMEIPAGKQKAYNNLKHKVKRFGDELAANPVFMSAMRCWMVDVRSGDRCETNPPTEEEFREVLDDLNFDKFVRNVGGGIAASVSEFVKHHGFIVTDRGGGSGSWHIGVPCNDTEAFQLCSMLHTQFKKAIDAGMIRVIRMFWGWKLPTMGNWNDVERYFSTES